MWCDASHGAESHAIEDSAGKVQTGGCPAALHYYGFESMRLCEKVANVAAIPLENASR
jgi:hypothetical protein